MGFFDLLGRIGKGALGFVPGGNIVNGVIDAAGSVLGGVAEGKAAGRSNQVNAQLTEEQINQARRAQVAEQSLAREADRRAGGASAFRESQYADYVRGGGQAYTPKGGMPSYGFGPKSSSQDQRDAAANYFAEQSKRLTAQDSLLPQVNDPGAFKIDPKALKAGLGENILGAVGGGLSAFSELTTAAQQRTYLEALMRSNVKLNDEETILARRLGMVAGPADISGGKGNV